MNTKLISQLTAASAITGAEKLELEQSSVSVYASVTGIMTAYGITSQSLISTLATQVAACPIWPGAVQWTPTISTPTGWLDADGSAISRTTYADLYAAITDEIGAFTVTIASPCLVTLNGHGLATGDNVELTTTGALPTGLSANTNYFVIYNNANSFWLASSLANALAGTKINTSGTQSGTHTLRYTPFGISGASNFRLPDLREVSPYGVGTRGAGVTAHDALVLGQMADDQIQGHRHSGLAVKSTTTNVIYSISGTSVGYPVSGSSVNNGTDPIDNAVRDAKTDGTNGTPRTGTVTRGKIIGLRPIIKT